jgi:small subunit ribosomal protein S6
VREYEVTIIIQPELEDEARNQLIERVQNWLAPDAQAEEKPVVNQWGKRKMAYAINNHREGYYVLYDVKADPGRIKEVERNMQFTEDILRYLVVRKES